MMLDKKGLLLILAPLLLTSCGGESVINRAVTYCMPEGDVVFNIVENSKSKKVGTMQFLPLKEKEISIRFDFDKTFSECFVFTYWSRLFEVARQSEPGEHHSAVESLFGSYPYVETKDSLHEKLSEIVFEGETRSVTQGKSSIQRIAINGSGTLIFKYDTAAFDPSKHFYTCEGLSFMPGDFTLCSESGKRTDEGCDVWYYISDGDIFN